MWTRANTASQTRTKQCNRGQWQQGHTTCCTQQLSSVPGLPCTVSWHKQRGHPCMHRQARQANKPTSMGSPAQHKSHAVHANTMQRIPYQDLRPQKASMQHDTRLHVHRGRQQHKTTLIPASSCGEFAAATSNARVRTGANGGVIVTVQTACSALVRTYVWDALCIRWGNQPC